MKVRAERAAAEEEVAQDYARKIVGGLDIVDWHQVNRDIIDRWSMSALHRIKRRAWQIVETSR